MSDNQEKVDRESFSRLFSRLKFSITGDDGSLSDHFNFLGIGIEALTLDTMGQRIDQWLLNKNSRSHHIACINAYCISLSLSDKRLNEIYNHSDIAGPDGMPFVRWIRIAVRRNADRFCAPDVALYLAKRAEEKGYTFYFYGGAPDVLDNMKKCLLSKFPYLRIVGSYAPPFRPLTAEEDAAICSEISGLKPDILLVGLGTPKLDYWIADHIDKIRGTVMVASGATFDFFGGRIKMAPKWIRLSGFEWLYRLFSKDFKRLWRRYTYYNCVFVINFVLQLFGFLSFDVKRRYR